MKYFCTFFWDVLSSIRTFFCAVLSLISVPALTTLTICTCFLSVLSLTSPLLWNVLSLTSALFLLYIVVTNPTSIGYAIGFANAVIGRFGKRLGEQVSDFSLLERKLRLLLAYVQNGLSFNEKEESDGTYSSIESMTVKHGDIIDAIQISYRLNDTDDNGGQTDTANSFYIVEGPWGGDGGVRWSDGTYSSIKSITVRHGNVIDAIQVEYRLKGEKHDYDHLVNQSMHGGTGGGSTLVNFAEDEYLTKIEGYFGVDAIVANTTLIRSLTFTTNKNTYGPYGTQSGTHFMSSGKGKIVGFYGHANAYLNHLGIYAC